MRRTLSLVAAGLLLLGVIAAVVIGRSGGTARSGTPPTASAEPIQTVRGVIGSEKQPFFQDPDVKAAFAAHGYVLQVDTAGSREIATTTDLSKYDFAFPAGTPQAQRIKTDHKVAAVYEPFFTPVAIATYAPIADLLTTAGVVSMQNGVRVLDVKAYMALVAKSTRWTDLPNNTTYPATKSVLVTTTDVRTSNSAAMYLALTSYVANGNNVVASGTQQAAVLPAVSELFLRQGFVSSSSAEPFNDYLSIGMGKTPMVLVYESQYRAEQIAKNGALTSQSVLLYPSPTVFSKHTLVPLNPKGDAIGQLLSTDSNLQHLAVKYGFRIADTAYMHSFAQQNGIPDVPSLVNVIDPPTFETLESMISSIDQLYRKEVPTS